MNSKERVAAAIARQPVDQVPLGFYAVDHDTVEKVIGRPTYVRNKIGQRVALWEGRRDEVVESLKKDTVEFYAKIDCADVLLPKEAWIMPPKDYEPEAPRKIADNKWEDKAGRVYQAVPEVNEIQCVHDPTEKKDYTVEDFEGPVDKTPPDPSVFEVIDYVIEHLGAKRYFATVTGGFRPMPLLGGTENGLMMYAMAPEAIEAANRQALERQNAMDQYYIRPNSPGALIEQDMAGSNAPHISPEMFREHCLPTMKARIANIKKLVPQVIFHNCGRTIPLMEQFIEAGVDCYQSLQTTAGMDIGLLKERFGDRLAFWGGVALEILVAGTPGEVTSATRDAMERGAPGGGFILGPSHSIAKGVKYENFMAMLDEFVRLRDKF